MVRADLKNTDGEGRVKLDTLNASVDLTLLWPLVDGMELTLVDGDLAVQGRAEFNKAEQVWTVSVEPTGSGG